MCRVFSFDLKATAAALFVSCVTAAAFCAVNGPSIAKDERAVVVLVDRTLKGDRLPSVLPTSSGNPAELQGRQAPRTNPKLPDGCEAAVSAMTRSSLAQTAGRCIS